jgi:hypothetical protein
MVLDDLAAAASTDFIPWNLAMGFICLWRDRQFCFVSMLVRS